MKSLLALAIVGLGMCSVESKGDAIPYPTAGVMNEATYTFVAQDSGQLIAYFAGSTASYNNELGLLVNGVDTGIQGLDNQTSAVGSSLNFGMVNAGDLLTFVLINHTLGDLKAYSDPSMNAAYDGFDIGLQHVYSTAYTGNPVISPAIPKGTFVSFEDLRGGGDFNYNDENFVFTNVTTAAVPIPSAVWGGALLLPLMAYSRIRRRLEA